jgi:hypothetical protein
MRPGLLGTPGLARHWVICAMDQNILRQYLVQTERHIARSMVHLARQRALFAELDRDGHDTGEARAILQTLTEALALHERDRERLLGLMSQRKGRAMQRLTIYRSLRQEDDQRCTRLTEMERQAAELLRHPAPDTFLGRPLARATSRCNLSVSSLHDRNYPKLKLDHLRANTLSSLSRARGLVK